MINAFSEFTWCSAGVMADPAGSACTIKRQQTDKTKICEYIQ